MMKRLLFLMLLVPPQPDASAQHLPPLTQTAWSPSSKMNLWYTLLTGDRLRNQGNLIEAEQHYLKAKEMADQFISAGSRHRLMGGGTIFDPYDRLGYLYLISNNPRKADTYFSASAELRNKHLPRLSVFRAYPYVGLAEVAVKLGDDKRAYEMLNEAEYILRRTTTSFYSAETLYKNILFNKSELLFRIKDYSALKKVLDKLLAGGSTFSIQNNEVRVQIPRVFDMHARYHMETGNFPKAREYLQKAKAFSKGALTAIQDFPIRRTEALMLWATGDVDRAAEALRRLTESYRDFVVANFSSMSEHEKEDFFLSLRNDFDLLNAFILEHTDHPKAPVFYQWAYDNQIFSKALLLNQMNRLKQVAVSTTDESLKAVYREWLEARGMLSSLYYGKKRNEGEILRLQARVEELERALNSKTGLLKTYSEEVDWKAIQSRLRQGETAAEIIRLKKFSLAGQNKFRFTDSVFYMVLTVNATGLPGGSFVGPANALENRYLNYYRNCIIGKLRDTLSYAAFWKPIGSQLGGSQKVFLSSDGVYNQINLNTLFNPQSGRFLLDEANLAFVTNTKDLLLDKPPRGEKRASLYGRPYYKLDARAPAQQLSPQGLVRELRSESLDDFRQQTFADLPGTESEISKIEQVLSAKGWKVSYFTAAEASESNLKSESGTRVLHVATHGFFVGPAAGEEISSMIRSGIVLAGVNNEELISGYHDDGILTAYEATSLDLTGTELVVLSACNTGLGETKNGIGVYGLQRGFTVAGASHLLMSLWKVDDAATEELMRRFYDAWLGGADVQQALRTAQRGMMESYPEPFYWGAFVLLGK